MTKNMRVLNRDRKNLSAAWVYGRKYIEGFPWYKENPFQAVIKYPEVKTPRYIPPEEDFWKIHALADEQDQVMLLFMLHTGARKQEVFKLKWEQVNLSMKTVSLCTRKREGSNLEVDIIPLTQALTERLSWWQEACPKKSEYVFKNLSPHNFAEKFYGKPFRARQHFMKNLCKRAGVKHFGFHAIRHLTATILHKEGVKLSVIQQVLRHKSATTTTKYLHSLGLSDIRDGLAAAMDGRAGQGRGDQEQ